MDFWWQVKGAPRGIDEKEKIGHDWKLLVEWYESFLKSSRGLAWISWFDKNFPESKDISNVRRWILSSLQQIKG